MTGQMEKLIKLVQRGGGRGGGGKASVDVDLTTWIPSYYRTSPTIVFS